MTKIEEARQAYERAKTNVVYMAKVTIEDPSTYIPVLHDAVMDMEDAWNEYVIMSNEAAA